MIPNEIKNRLIDALERADNPPSLHGVRGDIRAAVERDYRAIAGHLKAIAGWMHEIRAVQLREYTD